MAEIDDEFGRIGLMVEIVPNNGRRSNQSESSHTRMSRAAYNNKNYKFSGRCTETHKAGDYVTRSGNVGYKQESRSTSTVKYTGKVQGITTEYQAQVNVKKVVYPSAKSSSSKRINYY